MGNLADYRKVCREHRDRVKAIRSEHDKRTTNLERHLGSEYGKEETEKENKRFESELQAARGAFTANVDNVLSAMKTKLEENEAQVIPPSEEQLRLLTAVSLMTTVSVTDYLKYMKTCSSSDVAARTLRDLAQEKAEEGVIIPEYVTPYNTAHEQAKLLTDNARNLAKWDGEAYKDAFVKHLESKNVNGFSYDQHPAEAGSADPTSSDYFKEILGMSYDKNSLNLFD